MAAHEDPLYMVAVPALSMAKATRSRPGIAVHLAQLPAVEVASVDRIVADTTGRIATTLFVLGCRTWPLFSIADGTQWCGTDAQLGYLQDVLTFPVLGSKDGRVVVALNQPFEMDPFKGRSVSAPVHDVRLDGCPDLRRGAVEASDYEVESQQPLLD
ncbi:hypothetical protein [Streptomyces sp. NBC_00076]|uniref:hypothetical protein n=1 Tax=Streptomyces sp. NBC_00076 TaxID=2975642 RepID=UPI0032459DD6